LFQLINDVQPLPDVWKSEDLLGVMTIKEGPLTREGLFYSGCTAYS